MDLEILAQVFINGLLLGGIYALVAIGLTLIYGVMTILNFAHGEFLMLGMYLGYWSYVLWGIPPYVAVFGVFFAIFIFGVIVQSGLIQRMLGTQLLRQILLLLGISMLMTGLAMFFWKSDPRQLQAPWTSNKIMLGFLMVNIPRLVAFVSSFGIAIGLYLFLQKTKIGKGIRACSQSRDAAQLMGINVKHMYYLTFGIGVGVTAVAGVLLTPSYPVTPTIGIVFGVTSFVIVVLGTMGNFLGAMIGGLIIGIAETFGGYFLGSDVKQLVSMAIFILILLLMPRGLFGRSKA